MKEGQVYEVTEEWFKYPETTTVTELVPEFKLGAQFEILEIDKQAHEGITSVRFLNSNEVIHLEETAVDDLFWSFANEMDKKLGSIKFIRELA